MATTLSSEYREQTTTITASPKSLEVKHEISDTEATSFIDRLIVSNWDHEFKNSKNFDSYASQKVAFHCWQHGGGEATLTINIRVEMRVAFKQYKQGRTLSPEETDFEQALISRNLPAADSLAMQFFNKIINEMAKRQQAFLQTVSVTALTLNGALFPTAPDNTATAAASEAPKLSKQSPQ